jgi:hypothetical protein
MFTVKDFKSLFRSSKVSPIDPGLSPWTLACAVGMSNRSIAGHCEFDGASFDGWLNAAGLRDCELFLHDYVEKHSSESYYQVLVNERLRHGRSKFKARSGKGFLKIVFLDFDGVLVPKHLANSQHADPQCVEVLNEIIRRTDAKIVISSDWMLDYPFNALLYALNDWGVDTQNVIDSTPFLIGNRIRGLEIQAWLDERDERFNDVGQFVILDDYDDMLDLKPHLIHTTLPAGLQTQHVVPAVQILLNGVDGAN